jgi:hypothetical protein
VAKGLVSKGLNSSRSEKKEHDVIVTEGKKIVERQFLPIRHAIWICSDAG